MREEQAKQLFEELNRLRADNARLRRELEFKDQNISLLNRINSNMRASLRSHEVQFIILTAVTADRPGLGFNRAMLFLRDSEARALVGTMAISPDSEEQMHAFYEEVAERRYGLEFYIDIFYQQNLAVSNLLHEKVRRMRFERRVPNVLNAALNEKRIRLVSKPGSNDFQGIEPLAGILRKEFAVAPLLFEEQEIGVLIVDNHFNDRPIDEETLSALQTLTEFASAMIVTSRKYEEAERLSIHDHLTGLHTDRFLQEKLREEVERGRRFKRTVSLLLLDVDDLRAVNEANGHLAGNKTLMDLAALIRKTVRTVDVAARREGGEFAIILPETPKAGAGIVAEKILAQVRQTRFHGGEACPKGRLTVSAGVANYPEDGKAHGEILSWAEACLYRAKANGKDTVVL